MKKLTCLIVLAVLIAPLNCRAKNKIIINSEKVKNLIEYYFSDDANIADDSRPYFLTGDFNGDGEGDIAILFYPTEDIKPSKQLQQSWPWAFEGSIQSNKIHKSLAIINGQPSGWTSPNAKAFALLDKSGALETPSFQLMMKKRSEVRAKNILPIPVAGDILILPTEAGIDTYVYWDKSEYKLHVPDEIP